MVPQNAPVKRISSGVISLVMVQTARLLETPDEHSLQWRWSGRERRTLFTVFKVKKETLG
jgi:hypothetical protein